VISHQVSVRYTLEIKLLGKQLFVISP